MRTPPSSRPLSSPNAEISHLLSPSKARALASESASWTLVTNHLTSLFHPSPVPPFERNSATLSALLELIKANEDADAERRVVWDAMGEGLKVNEGRRVIGGKYAEDFVKELNEQLPAAGRKALDDLAASAVLLGFQPKASESTSLEGELSSLITSLSTTIFSTFAQLSALQSTSAFLSRQLTHQQITSSQLATDTSPEVLGTEELQSRTTLLNRESKVVGMKLSEYQERIKGLRGYDTGQIKLEDVVAKEKMMVELEDKVRRLEQRLLEMRGLPPDLEVSRKEVERARGELEEWKRRRGRAFEGLVE
jgi:HAUS augmin-like complex subunit 1